jgi:two-component system chemotaxis response regulator CheY
MKTLIVEDDFASRLVLQKFLSRYGECHLAANGVEGVQAFRLALEGDGRYDLICMDIMMPELDGRDALRQIRALEETRGIRFAQGVKIIMITAIDNPKEVFSCFRDLCDDYLMKPVDLSELFNRVRNYRLVQ